MNPEAVFELWADAALRKDTNRMADLYCEDGEHHFPFRDGAPFIKGREAIRTHLANTFGKAPFEFNELEKVIHTTDDPNTIVVECTFHGVKLPTRTPFDPSYVEIFTVRDGQISSVRDYENLAYRAGGMPQAA